MDAEKMKRYNMGIDQASSLPIELFKYGIPVDHLNNVIDAISGGYPLGHGDSAIGKEHGYSLHEVLKEISKAIKGGDI